MFNSSEGSQEEGEVCPHHKQRTHEEYHKDRNSQGRAMMGNRGRYYYSYMYIYSVMDWDKGYHQ